MQSSPVPWAASDNYKLVDEDQIANYLTPKQLKGGGIQVVLRSGRVLAMANFPEIAQISPGGWFKGVIRKAGDHWNLWGVVLCVAVPQFIHKRDDLRGYTRVGMQLSIDAYFDRVIPESDRKRARQAKIAKDNGDLRKIRELHAQGIHTQEDWLLLIKACGGLCLRCGATDVSKDHIVPLARGGTNSLSNLQPLCRSCNSWKGTKTIDLRDYSSPQIAKLLRNYYLPGQYPSGKGQPRDDDAGSTGTPKVDSGQRCGRNRIVAQDQNSPIEP